MPEDEELPPPSEDYFERETCNTCNYRWTDWLKLPPIERELMMVHELVKSKREGYYRERIAAEAKRKAKTGDKDYSPSYDPLAAIKARWGAQY